MEGENKNNITKKINNTVDYETLLHEKGNFRISEFKKILESVKLSLDEKHLFNSNTEIDIEKETQDEVYLVEVLNIFFETFQNLKSGEFPGHELAHIIDNLNSGFRISKEYNNLRPFEKFEIFTAIIGHDLGRYNEPTLEGIKEKDIEFLAPILLGHKLIKKADIKLPKNLQSRIIYDIASSSSPKTTGHITADTVHQTDREQLVGAAMIPRILADDGLRLDKSLSIKKDHSLEDNIPLPGSKEDTSILIQCEFFMRNLFPPNSPDGEKVIDELKKDTAIILMLGSFFEKEKREQIFKPEIQGIKEKEALHWSKKPLKPEIYNSAKLEAELFASKIDWSEFNEERLLQFIISVFESENLVLPDNYNKRLEEKIKNLSDNEGREWWMIMKFTKLKRIINIDNNLKILKKAEGPLEEFIASKIIPILEKRKDNYLQNK